MKSKIIWTKPPFLRFPISFRGCRFYCANFPRSIFWNIMAQVALQNADKLGTFLGVLRHADTSHALLCTRPKWALVCCRKLCLLQSETVYSSPKSSQIMCLKRTETSDTSKYIVTKHQQNQQPYHGHPQATQTFSGCFWNKKTQKAPHFLGRAVYLVSFRTSKMR